MNAIWDAPPAVPPGGYRWWYFDAISDDGARAFTAIFFIGSVFSPSYALRLRRGEAAAASDHLAVNLALYERGRQAAWVMSEYGAAELRGDSGGLGIASSAIESLGDGRLRLVVRERSAPFFASLIGGRAGSPVEGTVEVEPLAPAFEGVELAAADGHRHGWRVAAPRARIRVRFQRPAFSFDGVGYHDLNWGDGRLEAAFSRWSWARFHAGDRTVVLYAPKDRAGRSRALMVDARDGDGGEARRPREVAPGAEGALRAAAWGLKLPSWFAVDGEALRAEPTTLVEAAPFYARYLGSLTDGGRPIAAGLGEYLDLDRFRSSGIQFLLRFKTRRVS